MCFGIEVLCHCLPALYGFCKVSIQQYAYLSYTESLINISYLVIISSYGHLANPKTNRCVLLSLLISEIDLQNRSTKPALIFANKERDVSETVVSDP